jgi:hypothetical protein
LLSGLQKNMSTVTGVVRSLLVSSYRIVAVGGLVFKYSRVGGGIGWKLNLEQFERAKDVVFAC